MDDTFSWKFNQLKKLHIWYKKTIRFLNSSRIWQKNIVLKYEKSMPTKSFERGENGWKLRHKWFNLDLPHTPHLWVCTYILRKNLKKRRCTWTKKRIYLLLWSQSEDHIMENCSRKGSRYWKDPGNHQALTWRGKTAERCEETQRCTSRHLAGLPPFPALSTISKRQEEKKNEQMLP